MPARRYWPPSEHRLLWANAIVYGALVLLLVCFGGNLWWGLRTLRAYLVTGEYPQVADLALWEKARQAEQRGESSERVLALLEEAVQVDPHSQARMALAQAYERSGRTEDAIDHYEQFRRVNPSFLPVYKELADLYMAQDNLDATRALFDEGILHFQRQVEAGTPRPDPEVADEFNAKAEQTHARASRALQLLTVNRQRIGGLPGGDGGAPTAQAPARAAP